MTTRKIRIYACGGAALNICRPLYDGRHHDQPGFADVDIALIDTSRSNVAVSSAENFYHIQSINGERVDGSGKVRDTNFKAALKAAPQILHQFKPSGDLNIVMHSASGGSGSVVGPVLASELLAQSKNVITIMVGSTTCEQEIRNTINTILSYQGISETRGKATNVIYFENGLTAPMSKVDSMIVVYLLVLAAAWSGENVNLDSRDLENFLNYERVSKYTPALTGLVIRGQDDPLIYDKGRAISSVVTLVREGDDPSPGVLVGYHSYGTMSKAVAECINTTTPVHLCTVQGFFAETLRRLNGLLAQAEELYRVNQVETITVTATQDGGIVL